MANLFANAKTMEAPKKPRKKGEKEVVTIKGLDKYTALDTLMKVIAPLKEIEEKEIKDTMIDHFVDTTIEIGERPENFKGIDSHSEASCELRKRSSRSPLSPAELQILKASDISTQTYVIAPAQEEQFVINPEVVALVEKDARLAKEFSQALLGIKKLQGIDILLKMEAVAEESVQVIGDQSFADAAKIKDKAKLKQVMDIIGTMAVKAKLTTDKLDDVLEIVRKTGLKLKIDETSATATKKKK